MVNEHYVPQFYLRRFGPDNHAVVSRYSLIDTHGGGGYYSSEEYSVEKAASEEGFAGGVFEEGGAIQAEEEISSIFQKLASGEDLKGRECGKLSNFLTFQFERTPKQKIYYQSRKMLSDKREEFDSDGWLSEVAKATDEGHMSLQHFGWILLEDDSDVPLITSDHPVVSYKEDVPSDVSQEGLQIFYPIDKEHIIVLLHPDLFNVKPMYPDAHIERITVDETAEIHKLNLLQVLSAYGEIFGPAGENNYLRSLVEGLISAFPNEDFIRGPQCERKELETAHRIAGQGFQNYGHTKWYRKQIKPKLVAENREVHSLDMLNHNLAFIEKLRSTG